MKITINMPFVSECIISDCSYNVDEKCHARAITIGHEMHPGCDTFLGASSHTRANKQVAGVGACKVTECTYNDDFECVTESIRVGYSGDDINCLSFMSR